jgi:hypothetical protein
MSETISGLVERINKNDKGYYGVCIAGEWFGAGKYAPKFNEGDEVQFDYTSSPDGRFKNLTFNTVQILSKGSGSPSSSKAAPATSNSGGAVDWDAKDKRITFLACQKDAIQLAAIAVQSDALTLPAKKADRLEALVGLVGELSNDLYKGIYDEDYKEAE